MLSRRKRKGKEDNERCYYIACDVYVSMYVCECMYVSIRVI